MAEDILEVWETDPLGGCGCGCSPVRISEAQARRVVSEMNQRNETLNQLKTDFSGLKLERDTVHPQRPRSSYPDHVRELLDIGVRPPLFFLNRKLIREGVFPSYEELRRVIEEILKPK